jgi:hypothetical protein
MGVADAIAVLPRKSASTHGQQNDVQKWKQTFKQTVATEQNI